MGFGTKNSTQKHRFGIKKAIHASAGVGQKALGISAFIFPEFLPEIELARGITKEI